jgi:streptogramin lyase
MKKKLLSLVLSVFVSSVFSQTAPTAITLSSLSVDEEIAIGMEVGTLTSTDADSADTFTYLLVEGEGDVNNASFTISQDKLLTAEVFDFETKASYEIRVETNDGTNTFSDTYTITVNDINDTSTAIFLSSLSVDEDLDEGTEVGTFTTTDADSLDTFTYVLVEGEGDTNNTSFAILGDKLQTAEVFDFETKASYEIRVETNDGTNTFSDTYTITVNDINDTPTAILLSSLTVDEDLDEGTEVGTFTTTDADAANTFAYALVTGDGDTNNASFTISNDKLLTAEVFDFETKASYEIRVETNDGTNTFSDTYTITVNGIDKTVTLVASNTSIAEDETFTVTASINTSVSDDIVINLISVGVAKYSTDFTSNAATRISTIAGDNNEGSDDNQNIYPRGVFVDKEGIVYVADENYGRIQKFLPGNTEGSTIISDLASPRDIFVDANGLIYVLEHSDHKVSKWAADGSSLGIVAGGQGGGNNADQLNYPQALFVDVAGAIYIADSENNRIQKWEFEATEGTTVADINNLEKDTNGYAYFNNPTDVFVDKQHNIYVADYERILKWPSGGAQGEVIINNLDGGAEVFVDSAEHIYVLERNSNQVKKYNPGMSSGIVVAGGNGSGSNADQFNEPMGMFVDEMGTIYIADIRNHRVQKYDSSPQLIISEGDTDASLIFSGIRDTKDENTEAITLNTAVTGEGVSSTEVITVNITDINNPPTVAFTFSEDRIIENSNTDVMLIATLSDVSGKEITIDFTMGGTAVEGTDYNISSNTITIPAGSASGVIAISTAEIPADGLVESLDSIVFSVTTVTNATQVEDSATLFLESIEEPKVTLSVSKESIAENETFKITATLDAATSKDVVINFESAGTATAAYNIDYTSASETRIKTIAEGSSGSNSNQLSNPRGVFVDNAGNLYVADRGNGRIQKFAPGATEGQTLISGLNYPVDVFVDNTSGSIYVVEQNDHKVTKWNADGSGGEIVAGGAGNGSNANQLWNPNGLFVDVMGNVFVADTENHRIQKWAPGAIVGVTVAGGNNNGGELNQLYNPKDVFVDQLDNVFIADEAYGRIQKWAPGAIQGETVINGLNQPNDVSIDASGSIYVLERHGHKVTKYLAGSNSGVVVAGGEGRGNSNNQLNYPKGFFVDKIGNIYIADSDNHRVQKYDVSPQLVVIAGETEAVLLFSGKRDTTDEVDETIILNTSVSNALIASAEALTINLIDINEEPSVAFTFSEENITENSSTDVILTATLSAISGKAVNIVFTMEGTAVEDTDYILSSKTITIPANSASSTITISTKEIPADGVVEVLASIIFKVNEITNATAVAETATLFLESIENPNLTLVVSQESIAENEIFNVIATLDAAASKDVVVNFESVGIAIYNSDYTSNSITRISTIAGGNGYGNDQNQLQNPRGIFVDQAENVFVTNADRGIIQKFAPGVTDGETLIENLSGPISVSVDIEGSI